METRPRASAPRLGRLGRQTRGRKLRWATGPPVCPWGPGVGVAAVTSHGGCCLCPSVMGALPPAQPHHTGSRRGWIHPAAKPRGAAPSDFPSPRPDGGGPLSDLCPESRPVLKTATRGTPETHAPPSGKEPTLGDGPGHGPRPNGLEVGGTPPLLQLWKLRPRVPVLLPRGQQVLGGSRVWNQVFQNQFVPLCVPACYS